MKRLLVIRLGALGDLVHLSAALDTVRQAYPDLELYLLTRPAYAQLVALMPSITRAWFWNPHDGWPALFQLAETLRRTAIDGIVNLHPSFKTWLLTRLIHPKRETVYRKEKLRCKGRQQRTLARRHAIDDFYQPFRQLLPLAENVPTAPTLHLPAQPSSSDVEPASGLPALISSSTDPSLPAKPSSVHKPAQEIWIGLIPGVGGKRGNRAWPPEQWAELMRQLDWEEQTVRILLLGGADEQDLAAHLYSLCQEHLHPVGNLKEAGTTHSTVIENHCGRWDITGTAFLMSHCDIIIGGDTGPLHLAAGLGVPAIGLFGPTSPDRTGPRGTNSPETLTPPDELDCWPCEYPTCPLTGDRHLACMHGISASTVLAALREKLRPHLC